MTELRIVFMGTPEFATGILQCIMAHGYNVVGVITAPDKPAGRGQKIKYSSVKDYAMEKNLKILQPINLKEASFLSELQSLNANVHVVVAFRMLPEAVWRMPDLGTFNLHASLLPDYRGAAPINWAIINGERKTGVTTFFIDDKIDTGAIILSRSMEISPNENAGQLHDELKLLGAEAVVDTLKLIESGKVNSTLQDENANHHAAPKLTKENSKIDFSKSGTEIHNFVRGLSPYPASWCVLYDQGKSWNVKIHEAAFISEFHQNRVGMIVSEKKQLLIALADGYLRIDTLQFPDKKKIKTAEFLNGMSFTSNAFAG